MYLDRAPGAVTRDGVTAVIRRRNPAIPIAAARARRMLPRSVMANFAPSLAKLTIGSLDDTSLTVQASYNPKELGLSKQLSWKDANEGDRKVLSGKAPPAGQDSIELTGHPVRTMTIELLFDGYETGKSIAPQIEMLDTMSSPLVPIARREDRRRPHFCVVTWGQAGIPAFRCVIEKLDVKYTMFDRDGMPLRATCTVSVKEAALSMEGSVDSAVKAVQAQSRYRGDRAIIVVGPTGEE
jgi:hypothetical protein